LSDPLGSLGADRRKEADEEFPTAILRSSRLEGVPEEVERDVFCLPKSVVILAIHDSGLRRVKLQFALRESTTDGVQHRTRLPLTPAMDDGIVRIALELDVRKRPPHPEVERVMQEEIGQQRTRHSALRRASRPLFQSAVWFLHRGTKPPCDVQPDPRAVGVVRHGTLDQFMRDGVKEGFPPRQ
jgi:hypothetical protein